MLYKPVPLRVALEKIRVVIHTSLGEIHIATNVVSSKPPQARCTWYV